MKQEGPSFEELEIIRNAARSADPHTYTPLPPLEVFPCGTVDFYKYQIVEDAQGRRYVEYPTFQWEKNRKNGPTEEFLSRLLKGIVPISDVLAFSTVGEKKYYSHIILLEKTQKEVSNAELEAYGVLLGGLFGDPDHTVNVERENRRMDNAIVTKDKAAIYDLSYARRGLFIFGLQGWQIAKISPEAKGIFREKCIQIHNALLDKDLHAEYSPVTKEVLEKCDAKFLYALLVKVGVPTEQLFLHASKAITELEAFIEFHHDLLMEIEAAITKIDKVLAVTDK